MSVFRFSKVDFLFTCLGLIFLLLDIVLDIYAVVCLYQQKAYWCLGILLLFLVVSSVLIQAFSLLWYSYDDFERRTRAEKCVTKTQLKILHVLQMGNYFRHAGVVEVSLGSVFTKITTLEQDDAVYLSHDLSMLRLIETFSESAPQLVLMLTIILQRGHLGLWTVLKATGSAMAIACSVTMYHRSLRSFLPEKQQQVIASSALYFFWNLLLIMSRITALALFASVLPCFIFTHFICSWLVLFFFVWRSQTDFMESSVGEWLYRCTVGLIWYFEWFNVMEGRTRYRTLLYHGYIFVDISLLCGLWCWKMITDPPFHEVQPTYAIISAVCVVLVYILGLFFKMIYYKFYHPNLGNKQLKGDETEMSLTKLPVTLLRVDEPDSISAEERGITDVSSDSALEDRSLPSPPTVQTKHCNKRMRKLAEKFYS